MERSAEVMETTTWHRTIGRKLFSPGMAEFPFGASRYGKAPPAVRSHTIPQVKPTELGLNQGNKHRKVPE
jgi:hypothetical protein